MSEMVFTLPSLVMTVTEPGSDGVGIKGGVAAGGSTAVILLVAVIS